MIKKLLFSLFTYISAAHTVTYAIPEDPYLKKLLSVQEIYQLSPQEACYFIVLTKLEDINKLSEIPLEDINRYLNIVKTVSIHYKKNN